MDELCIVYVTSSNRDEALKIGRKIVDERLAACVNVYDGVTSLYRWEGKMQEDSEAVLFMKTKKSLLAELKDTVKKLHSYSCPCIVALPIVDPEEAYASWILNEVK